MSVLTSVLKLFKYDPVADKKSTYNITQALNDNWDKIDAAMAVARSAEEYDPAATYAVGSYCTHDGKLYRCTTAITAAEAWSAAHWAATTVGAELLAIIAALAGKATVNYGAYTSLNDLLTVPSGFYTVNPPATNMPINAFWFCIVCAEQPNAGTRIIYAMPVGVGNDSLWKIRCTGGVPETGKEMATATPPTEYDLPLEEGTGVALWAADRPIICRKNQFGEVKITGQLHATSAVETETIIAILPEGYHPKRVERRNLIASDGLYHTVEANASGLIQTFNNVIASGSDFVLDITFDS